MVLSPLSPGKKSNKESYGSLFELFPLPHLGSCHYTGPMGKMALPWVLWLVQAKCRSATEFHHPLSIWTRLSDGLAFLRNIAPKGLCSWVLVPVLFLRGCDSLAYIVSYSFNCFLFSSPLCSLLVLLNIFRLHWLYLYSLYISLTNGI